MPLADRGGVQCTELGAIVPVVQRGCARLVLAGDHCQLPPSVQSQEAERRGLSLSLYGRLVRLGLEPFFLDTQFRSHPKLVEFVASEIYGGKLKSGITGTDRPALPGFAWPDPGVPLAFVEMGAENREEVEGESKQNSAEGNKVLDVLQEVLAAGACPVTDVGIITPYVAQVRATPLWEFSRKGSKSA
jgi:superfamily I DNA and/or RNA helicase